MADNVPLNLGTGPKRAATDEVSYSGETADVQLVRLVDVAGAEGGKTVTPRLGLSNDELRAAPVSVTGTFFQATQPVSFTWQGLTDAQLRASAVPVSLTWAGLTDAQLRASAVPVSFTWSGLTDAQLRAAPVPFSAASLPLPAGASTETTLAAVQALLNTIVGTIQNHNAPFVDGSPGQVMLGKRRDSDTTLVADGDLNTLNMDEAGRLKVATQPASYAVGTGNITANAQTVFLNVDRASNVTISMVATSLVGHNATFEYSHNSTNGTDGNWYGVQVARSNANTAETTTGVLAATPAYGWEVSVNAYKWIRIRATAHTSGTAAYTITPGSYATEPVPVIQTHAVTGSGNFNVVPQASTARVGFVAGAGIWYDDSATVLAANATFTGTSRDATVTATATAFANAATYAMEVRVAAESDQTGTLWLEVSRDNAAWRRVKSVATAAVAGGGQYAEIVHRPSWRYWRVGFTNGATLQTRFSIGSIAIAA